MSDRFVYLLDGTKCRVAVSPDDGSGMVVYTQVPGVDLYGCGCSENMVDDALLLVQPDEVFDNLPVEVMDEQIKLKQLELARLTNILLSRELQELEAELQHKAFMQRYANYSGILARLDDVINGRITHFLLFPYSWKPRIAAIEELLDNSYDANWGKILSLTATKWPNLTWTLGKVHMSKECVPCTSYAEAQKAGQIWVDEQIASGEVRHSRWLISFAIEHNLVLPDGYIKAVVDLEKLELGRREEKELASLQMTRLTRECEWKDLLNE